ncbi:hypothetical protein LSH36_266g04077 [Paralvinella palmiformis]|uniref:RNA-dependent RNA polymerase n=1 Tax=Paralvinella palmiformis TaxID=53620 RepID=A0AAD9N509_9ANNE|nr:hypothetical protein LSH36_266g04077 [Paralvinella palmiformis]
MERIKQILMTGLTIKGRTYEFLGSSNSQLRRNGCWMYARDNNIEDTVQDIRHWMGDVANIRCVALYMARLGQFFSSSTEVVDLSNDGYTIEEIEDVKRNGYCFTEGAGRVAKDIANEGCKRYGIKDNCSAFQIRLGGCKCVLSIDNTISKGVVQIGPSMKKFDSNHRTLEVIDYSRKRERACEELDDIQINIKFGMIHSKNVDIELSSVDIPEWYKLKTEKHYDSYAEQMRQILETYGFKDESHMLASSVYRLSLHTLYKSDIHEMALLMKAEIKELTTHFNGILLANDDPQVNINTKMAKVEYLRDRKTQSWRKSPDVRIRVETKRKIYNPKSSLYEFILDKPLVFAKSDKQLDSNIPRLDVSVKYTEKVKSIRQKRITTYKYPLEKVAEKLYYFTANIKVEISNVRETSFYDGKNHENEFSDVRILLPKLSPLHYKDGHDDAIRGMINLGFLISNLIS